MRVRAPAPACAFNTEIYQAVVDKDGVAGLNTLNEAGIVDIDGTRGTFLGHGLVSEQSELLAFTQRHGSFFAFKESRADLGPFGVSGHGTNILQAAVTEVRSIATQPYLLKFFPQHVDESRLMLVATVREIQSHDSHAGKQQFADHFRAVCGWSHCANDSSFPVHKLVLQWLDFRVVHQRADCPWYTPIDATE